MRHPPAAVGDAAVQHALRAWGIEPRSLEYAPVGFGDHHWIAHGDDSWFVTLSDLADKDHCGTTAQTARRGLTRAMDTALELREHHGLDFVVAPVPTLDGRTLLPLADGRHAVAVFPLTDGTTSEPDAAGFEPDPVRRSRTLTALAALHRTPPPSAVPVLDPELSARPRLEKALYETDTAWSGGPFSEPARALLAQARPTGRLRRFDRLAERVRRTGAPPVVTHGEPHPGNVLWQGDRCLLVDWDTVGLAPPERDLWQIADDPSALALHTELTGRAPDPETLALYRLRWDLEDLTVFLGWFRSPHVRDPDTELAWLGFTDIVTRLARESSSLVPDD